MKLRILLAVVWIELIAGGNAFGQSAVPSKNEIAEAYRSKDATGPMVRIPWVKRRTQQVRDWSVKFMHLADERPFGVLIRRYGAVAKRNGVCAEYQVVEMISAATGSPRVQPSLVVEPGGLRSCL